MSAIRELEKKVAQGNVVAFVGTGLSVAAGFPNWSVLVEEILTKIQDKEPKWDKFQKALKDEIFTPLDVLNKIAHLREEVIEAVEKILTEHSSAKPTQLHFQLGSIFDQIITTNYDSLIEDALPNFQKVIYSNKYRVAKLSSFNKYIFKIHGDISEPDNFILFPTEYDKLYSGETINSTFELKKIISSKSILFIGFSYNDPYITQVFEYISDVYSGFNPEHFIVTDDKNRVWPHKITPIQIDNYGELEPLFQSLIDRKQEQNDRVASVKNEIETTSQSNVTHISEEYEYDSPPSIKVWVGREREIENIRNGISKVVFITGIGGQGKSALAAHFIRNYFDSETYEFADWRDFKEEANRFHTKLISIIQRLSPDSSEFNFDQLSNKDLIDTFFHVLKHRRIIFVFDNIDNYIDLESFKPTGSFDYFFEQIISRDHKSRFIFTCRPFIRDAGVEFYQITLKGISSHESYELFKLYNISINDIQLQELSLRAHQLTKGHPLWLNLIAGQATRGIDTVTEFMTQIEGKTTFSEDNFSSILSEKILSVVWRSLNDKQKILIRGIAETVRPEAEENLKLILDTELNSNQFIRSLRTLKNLSLIETLTDGEIELHPLVKEFVLTKFPKNERARFITLFVKYYDRFIYILKPNLSWKSSIQDFQNWTLKIELQINKNDFKSALIVLEEVSDSILAAGYCEEYLRVAHKLYDSINWETAMSEEYPYFHSQFYKLSTTLSQMGYFKEADKMLEKYVKYIPGKSAKYLAYCSERMYNYWFSKDYSKSIQIGEEGVDLMEEAGLADSYDLRHNLALSYRDSKDVENVQKALEYFSHNEDPEKLLSANEISKDLGGSYYGNMGRCYEYLNKNDYALRFYSISFKLLLLEEYINTILNLGYASFWIGGILMKTGKNLEALYFLKFARNCWDKTSPPRSKEAIDLWNSLGIDINSKNTVDQISDWKIKDYCSTFVAQRIG